MSKKTQDKLVVDQPTPSYNASYQEYDRDMVASRVMKEVDANPVAVVSLKHHSVSSRTNLASVKPLSKRIKDSDNPNKGLMKGKIESKADYLGSYKGISGVIEPEYDLLEPFSIYDTEVYVKQATSRRLSLMFRNGWDIVSDISHNEKNVKYIKRRLSTLEYVMGTSVESFFTRILFDLLLCSNCFLLKIRDEKASPGVKSENNGNKVPVAGYVFIPSNQIMPWFEQGRLKFWRRFYETGIPYEDYSVNDIIHLKWDVKNGHFFGCPRLVGVVDDIYALRRLEENIELLFVNYLFPLFHVTVGNKDAPCWYGPNGESEIDIIRGSIENMPKEGVFVTDERVAVDPVGAQGQALDTKDLIAHLKQRVLSGLGVSSLDVGEAGGVTRTSADNVSQNLKDQIKKDMTSFCDLIRMHFFREWFDEANYSLSVQQAVATTHIRFNEIDLDNKIKLENHYIQLWLNDAITEDEYRRLLNYMPMDPKEEGRTHSAIVFQRELELAEMGFDAQADVAAMKVSSSPASGGKSGKGARKKSATKARPTNQHGTNPGPTKAKSSREDFYRMVVDRIAKLEANNPDKSFQDLSGEVLTDLAELNLSDSAGYTKEPRTQAYKQEITQLIALVDNSEMLSILVEDNLDRLKESNTNELQGPESQHGIPKEGTSEPSVKES